MFDLCSTVAGMVTPKGSMSTEGEKFKVSVLRGTLQVLDMSFLLSLSLGSCAAEIGSSEGSYELPYIVRNKFTIELQQTFKINKAHTTITYLL
jgi:hypothetical protein